LFRYLSYDPFKYDTNRFSKALEKHGTISATVSNTAVNVIVSSMLGYLCFGEVLGPEWVAGAFMSILGTYCIKRAVGGDTRTHSREKTE